MAEIEAVSLNVIIRPTDEIAKAAIELSSQIAASVPTYYVLNPDDTLPHLTIYQALFPKKNLSAIKDSLSRIGANSSSFLVSLGPITLSPGGFNLQPKQIPKD